MRRHLGAVFTLAMACSMGASAQDQKMLPAPSSSAAVSPSLSDLLEFRTDAVDPTVELRNRMIAASAQTVGFRAGLASKGKDYVHMLEQREPVLDRMFQFQTLLGPGGVLPPVIEEARDTAVYGADDMRAATVTYKILRTERLVSNPPTWRDYLEVGLITRQRIELPQGDAKPKNSTEMVVWKKGVKDGWSQGEAQAAAIFSANLHRLSRDFTGMLRYSILLRQGVMTPTQVAESHRAVMGDTMQITVDSRTRQITAKARMQTDPTRWRLDSPLRNDLPASNDKRRAR